MTHIKIYYKKLGGHVHCRVFSGQNQFDLTFAKCGDLTFNEQEWAEVRDKLGRGAEIIPE